MTASQAELPPFVAQMCLAPHGVLVQAPPSAVHVCSVMPPSHCVAPGVHRVAVPQTPALHVCPDAHGAVVKPRPSLLQVCRVFASLHVTASGVQARATHRLAADFARVTVFGAHTIDAEPGGLIAELA